MLFGTAYAQGAAAGGPSPVIMQFIMIGLIFLVFYFLIIRPNGQRMKRHREMVANVRRNDTIVTSGGIVGKVTKVEDDEVEAEIAKDVRVRVVKSTIADVKTKSAPANDKDGGEKS